MDKVQKSINDLQRRVEKSNKIVAKGEKIGYGDAIKLGRKSNSITNTIKKAIKEYDGTTPSEAESKKILDQMTIIVELTETQLNGLVANKEHFEKLKVGGKM
jgi:fumarate hydratase class II